MSTAPVTAVIVTKDPRMDHLGMTLSSLADQRTPPEKVIQVDSTEGGLSLESGCSFCPASPAKAVASLEDMGVEYELKNGPSLKMGEARREGISATDTEYVWHLDEDAVIQNADWVENAISTLRTDGVAAVGGSVIPIDESKVWGAVASADNAVGAVPGGWYLMHPVAYCRGEQCTLPGQHRGEDVTLRQELSKNGALVRLPQNVAAKDLPTDRQKWLRDILISSVGGSIAGLAASALEGGVKKVVQK